MKDIVTQLRANSECLAPSIMLEAADMIERLTAERDEARREVCMCHPESCVTDEEAHQQAQERGWDCFKEKAP